MRVAVAIAAILLASAFAGCASKTTESNAPTPVNGSSGGSTNNTTTTAGSDVAFLLVGPRLLGADGHEKDAFHEDDVVTVHYEIGLTSSATSGATAFASYLVNGKVLDVKSIHLEPGQRQSFDPVVDLHNLTKINVEVKVGAADGKDSALILKWPRQGDALPLGAATVTLTQWTNATEGIHVDLDVTTPADGSVTGIHVKLLCLDAKGKLSIHGDLPVTDTPGQTTSIPLDFAACSLPYGLGVYATDVAAGALSGRILFH